jgi:signal transduction histidine kinase
VYKQFQRDAETVTDGREPHARLQPSRMSGLTKVGVARGERVARDAVEVRRAGRPVAPPPRYTEALLALTDDSRSGITIGQLARRVLLSACVVLRTDAGHVLEVDASGTGMRVIATRGMSMMLAGAMIDPRHAAARLLASGDAMLAVDDYLTGGFTESPFLREAGVRSGITVMIRGMEQPYGFVTLYAREPRSWTAEETEFLQLAANVLSAAVATKLASADRRLLMSRLIRAQEEERKRIAIEVHDDAVQVMTAVNLQLSPLIDHLEGQEYKKEGRQVAETVRLTIGRLRRLLFQLVPPALHQHGLASSLRLLLESLEDDTALLWELDDQMTGEPSPTTALVVYRIVQEALVNIRKHARATHVLVRLVSSRGGVDVRIEDDGCGAGADVPPVRGHLGVAGMGARAEMSGGKLRVRSLPGLGTVVECWIPDGYSGDVGETAPPERNLGGRPVRATRSLR